uniref:RNA helicase n=1 Tax=Acrobeloides nanus TaxID=290746 RepID=A0A914CXW3_9BILA
MHIGGRSNNNSNRGGSRFSNNGGSYNNRGRSNYGENNNMRGNGYRTNGFSSGGFRSAQGDGSKNDWYSTTKVQKVDFAKANLVPLQKNFYKLHAAVQQRGQAEVDQWLAEKNVTLDGEDIPRPVVEFSEGGFPDEIQSLFNAHFTKPTVIQSIAWPVALSGRDLIAIAQTGSGKTLG